MNLVTPEDIEPSNIIGINPDCEKEIEIRLNVRREGRQCYGQHKNVVVDVKLRTVTCRDCERVIDPFEYLLKWAQEGDRRMTALKRLDIQTRLTREELARLTNRLDNVRATLKRNGSPQPDRERMDFKSQLLNAGIKEMRIHAVDAGKAKEPEAFTATPTQ